MNQIRINNHNFEYSIQKNLHLMKKIIIYSEEIAYHKLDFLSNNPQLIPHLNPEA